MGKPQYKILSIQITPPHGAQKVKWIKFAKSSTNPE
jgi:hypothetical protein